MSPFFTPTLMFPTLKAPTPSFLKVFTLWASICLLLGCSSTGQQQASQEIAAVEKQEAAVPGAKSQAYLGSYTPGDPPRLSNNEPYDPLNPELSETVGVPFLSFLIIEPDPVTKNAIPSDIEKMVKARKYPEAIDLINAQLKKTPRNIQLRFVKARLQLEMRQLDQAKKTLIEITQQFPELPEPYNNLAAIAANQGNWIEARDYLELALKLRPSYVTAAANLGEVYIRLGAKAYEDAATNATLNQRQYTMRATALLGLLKPTSKRPIIRAPQVPDTGDATPSTIPSTNSPESKLNNGESTSKNQ
jgi:tetratricopeptide (TPR) repeat protein